MEKSIFFLSLALLVIPGFWFLILVSTALLPELGEGTSAEGFRCGVGVEASEA